MAQKGKADFKSVSYIFPSVRDLKKILYSAFVVLVCTIVIEAAVYIEVPVSTLSLAWFLSLVNVFFLCLLRYIIIFKTFTLDWSYNYNPMA